MPIWFVLHFLVGKEIHVFEYDDGIICWCLCSQIDTQQEKMFPPPRIYQQLWFLIEVATWHTYEREI